MCHHQQQTKKRKERTKEKKEQKEKKEKRKRKYHSENGIRFLTLPFIHLHPFIYLFFLDPDLLFFPSFFFFFFPYLFVLFSQVPRPSSSKMTSECSDACARMVAVSRSSTMNVERPAMMLSLAPMRVNTRSAKQITKDHKRTHAHKQKQTNKDRQMNRQTGA
jgi:hypothetical protein